MIRRPLKKKKNDKNVKDYRYVKAASVESEHPVATTIRIGHLSERWTLVTAVLTLLHHVIVVSTQIKRKTSLIL